MRRVLAVLGLVLASLMVMPHAEAGEVAPVVKFDRAWLVARGAAVEASYIVRCPDPSDAQHPDYRHAISTNGHFVEFRCTPTPRRVTVLLPGEPPRRGESLTLTTRVFTPQCLYWDTSELENGEQGCWKIDRTDTVRRLQRGAFVPESSVDIGSHIDVRRVHRTRNGDVRLRARFDCVGGWNNGPVTFEVRQRTRAGHVQSATLADAVCDNERFTRTFTVPAPSDRRFRRGPVVVRADWVEWPEGGPWAYYTGVHRLR